MKELHERTLDDLRDEVELLKGLRLHGGWRLLLEFVELSRDAVERALDEPLPNVDAALAQEFHKGQRFELKAMPMRVDALIDNYEREIAMRIEQEKEDGPEQTT